MADAIAIPAAPATPVDRSDSPVQLGQTADVPAKLKGRQRLLRGIQRISSSPSLAQLGRPRAHSSPYTTRGSFSCVSLASATPASPFAGSPFASGAPSPTSTPGTDISEIPFFDGIENRLAIRRWEHGVATVVAPTAPLPADLRSAKLDGPVVRIASAADDAAPAKPPFRFWDRVPYELQVHIFSYFQPKELVRTSRVSRAFHKLCFDGQLWTSFDASEFYKDIPAESLSKIIVAAGPFIKDLNLRGCVQVEHYKRAEVIVKACKNLINATLEGCRNFQRNTLHSLLRTNEKLAHLNLTGLTAVTNTSCIIIAECCPQLEAFNVSWCRQMDARGIKTVVEGCGRLRDLRAGEVAGFDNLHVAEALFKTNNLERLVLSGCADLTDRALRVMLHGPDPEIDLLTDRPMVPPRRLRHLDLSRCTHLTSHGVRALGHFVPDLEGLQLSGCTALADAALEPVLATTPRLTHLELEDLADITNGLLAEHLAKAPCASRLEHLSISYCENVGDAGMLPVMKSCVGLRSVDMDNTRISDLVLAEAAQMAGRRAARAPMASDGRPRVGLHMVVYDCQNVTWTGVREVLFRNTQAHGGPRGGGGAGRPPHPAEIISLKCFYGFQMTVDEHTKRVLRGDLHAAGRLERKWADYMQATEEAGTGGAGVRRRRRRAREAQMLHANEEDGGAGAGGGPGRRRARTAGSCTIM